MIKPFLSFIILFSLFGFILSNAYKNEIKEKQDKEKLQKNQLICKNLGVAQEVSCGGGRMSALRCRIIMDNGSKLELYQLVAKGDIINFCENTIKHSSLENYYKIE